MFPRIPEYVVFACPFPVIPDASWSGSDTSAGISSDLPDFFGVVVGAFFFIWFTSEIFLFNYRSYHGELPLCFAHSQAPVRPKPRLESQRLDFQIP